MDTAGGNSPLRESNCRRRNAMQAIAVDEFGGRARLKDAPVPEPAAGEVLVRVRAAGVNPFDWQVADGVLKDSMDHTFPLILGFDAAGTVERVGAGVGAGVGAFRVDDEVFGPSLRQAPIRSRPTPGGRGTVREPADVSRTGHPQGLKQYGSDRSEAPPATGS